MSKAFEQGLMDKLAQSKTKTASTAVKGTGLSTVSGLLTNSIPGVALANLGGAVGGYFDPPSEQEKEEIVRRKPGWDLVPGAGPYNVSRRGAGVAEESKAVNPNSFPYAHIVGERLTGPASAMLASTLAGSALGAGIGAGVGGLSAGGEGAGVGALGGAGIGAGVGMGASGIMELFALLRAARDRRRTREEQASVDSSEGRLVAKHLIPGMATYDSFKRLGRSRDWDDKYKEDGMNKTSAFQQGFMDKLAQYHPYAGVGPIDQSASDKAWDAVRKFTAQPKTPSQMAGIDIGNFADEARVRIAAGMEDGKLLENSGQVPRTSLTLPPKPAPAAPKPEPTLGDQAGELFDKAKGTATDLYGKAKGWVTDPANREKMMYGGAGIGAGLGLYGLYNLLNRPAPRRRPRPGDEYQD